MEDDEKMKEESSTIFKKALGKSPVVLFNQDRELRYTWFYNPHPGFDPDNVIGKTDVDLLPEDAPHLIEIKKQVIESGIGTREEVRTIIQGKAFYYDLAVAPLLDEADNIVGITCAAVDITERKRVEEELRLNKQTLDHMAEGVLLINHDLIIIYTNPKLEKMFGYQSGELLGEHISILNAPTEQPPMETANQITLALREEGQWRGEIHNIKKDETLFWSRLTITTFEHSKHGTVWLTVQEDITKSKQAEQKLQESEEQLKRQLNELEHIYQSLPIGFCFVDKDLRYLQINQVLADINGASVESHIGKTIYEAIPEIAPQVEDLYKNVIETGKRQSQSIEAATPTTDGEIRSWWIDYYPIFKEDRSVIGVSVIVQDITERKYAEEELNESEERFRQMADQIREVVFLVDHRDYSVLYVNPAYEEIYGQTCQSLYDNPKAWLDAIYPDDKERINAALEKQQKAGFFNEEFRIVKPDGKIRWISDRLFPIKNEFGEVYRLVGIAEDITERKQLEDQLRQAHKMEALGTLAGGIAHDFNNLLVPILGITEMEYNKLDPESKIAERLKRVLDSARKAKDLVFQILVFSHKAESKKEVVYLKEIVDESLKLLRSTLPSTISIKYEVNLPRSKILADSIQIHQVIMNLCINASHAMPEGGELNIKTETVEHYQYLNISGQNIEDTFVCLSVQDTGYGMDEQIIKRIFEPFFTTKEKGPEKGTGLGLAMVSGIMTQHEGHIEVESEVESDQHPGGTTFRVYFPLITSEEDAGSEELPHPLLYGEENILFIDDEPMVNDTGTFLLEELGYHMTSFTNPKEALEAFQAKPHDYDLVITDMSMRPMTGVVLAEKMREIRSDIPIILCTGHNDTVSENKLGEWKLDALIMKPYEQVQLSQVVRSVLDQIKS